MKTQLNKTTKYFFGIGDLGFALMSNVELYYFAFFLTDIAKLPLTLLGLITTVINIADLVCTPVWGVVVNRMKPLKWGRYRSWLLLGPVIVMCFHPIMFSKIGSDITATVIIIAAALIYKIGNNFAYISSMSLIPLMASNDYERGSLSANKRVFQQVGRLLIGSFLPVMITFLCKIVTNHVAAYSLLAFITDVCLVLSFMLYFKWAKEFDVYDIADKNTATDRSNISLADMLRTLIQNKSLLALFVSNLFVLIPARLVNTFAVYYFTYVVENYGLLATYLLVYNSCGIAGAFLANFVSQEIESRRIIIFSLCFAVASLVFARLLYTKLVLFTVFMALYNLGIQFGYPFMVALYGDCAVYAEYLTGKDVAGFTMGLLNICGRASTLCTSVLLTASLAAIGYETGVVNETLKTGIVNIFTGVPFVCTLSAFVIFVFCYRLTRIKIAEAKNILPNSDRKPE